MFLSSIYQQKTIQNHQNVLGKDLKDWYIGMNKKENVRINIKQTSIHVLLNFVDGSGKRVNGKKYYLLKGSTKSDNLNVNGKNFYSRPIDSDIKQYEEITKLTTKQGEDYTTGCLLNYDYITKKV